jgi:5-formyltetrahydrofolate cyclo-ligase
MAAEERAVASAAIAARLSRLVEDRLAAGAVVALYASKGSEVATQQVDGFARARGLRVVYPRVARDHKQLELGEVAVAQLVPARYGLLEPAAGAPLVAVEDVAAFVIPGIAFDRAGGRIGWGRGHYDATLARAPGALRVALAFECQIVDAVPREPHDIAVHFIITEVATHVVA